MMRTGNPALNDKVFNTAPISAASGEVMTLEGTVNKTTISIVLTMAAAAFSWSRPEFLPLMIPFMIGALIVSLIIIFKKTTAPYLTPVYAVAEGLMLGVISRFFEMSYPGIVFQAVTLTFGTLFCLLMAYRSGLIKASENFKLGIVAATGAVFVFYIVTMIMGFFGVSTSFMQDSSPLSIGISVVIVIIAALNLVLDFDFIENAAARGNTPKYMEWYAAFGLLVTLIWLYMEILRLLAKLQSRNR